VRLVKVVSGMVAVRVVSFDDDEDDILAAASSVVLAGEMSVVFDADESKE